MGRTGSGSSRDGLAALLAMATVVCLGSVFLLAEGTAFLMPGPLTSAHGAIKNCGGCHTQSGDAKLSWVHGLVAGNPLADSKACLACHKMPDTAFNAHGASAGVLKTSTERLTKIAARTPAPQSARAQNIAFPTHEVVAQGLYCATCHQEHQGANFNLKKISSEQCRSCHVVKFDSFDGQHPKFENFPFKRRTPIIYDHAGHFDKHYPELAKKDPAKRLPATCSVCHDSGDDKRLMAVAPFEKTCSTCHLDQIVGKERASGPKGVAFLTVPGLDLESLKKKNASIGEWPEASEAALTPFMKVMISQTEPGRALIKTVEGLNLLDLTNATDDQIKAVTTLVWEIKGLFHALISGKASEVLGDLNLGAGAKLSADLVADLTASIPRDVVISAQQQWLPALAAEITNRKGGVVPGPAESNSAPSASSETPSSTDSREAAASDSPEADESISAETSSPADTESGPDESETPEEPPGTDAPQAAKLDPPACVMSVLGACLVFKGQDNPKPDGGKEKSSAEPLPPPMRAGVKDGQAAAPKAGDQSDDLLFPTAEELRELKARGDDGGKAAQPAGTAQAGSATAGAEPQTKAAPVVSIDSGVDPESWAEYGGWYRQDYAIFYRPTGHKDKFVYSWLFLSGPQAPKGDKSPAGAVFDYLTSKDAQGSCTKCHSVDNLQGKGRVVNFSPPSVESKQGRFTHFIHEPHFGIMEDRGCLTCHSLEKGQPGEAAGKPDTANAKADGAVFAAAASKANATAPGNSGAAGVNKDAEKAGSPYLKSYEQGDPQIFESNFGAVKKDLCLTCHTSSKARQDCLTCHKYHVNGVVTPIMKTKIPAQ